MIKCEICGSVSEYEVTPYTGAVAGTLANYCHDHALSTMQTDNTKTYKFEAKEHVYATFKARLGAGTSGGYVK